MWPVHIYIVYKCKCIHIHDTCIYIYYIDIIVILLSVVEKPFALPGHLVSSSHLLEPQCLTWQPPVPLKVERPPRPTRRGGPMGSWCGLWAQLVPRPMRSAEIWWNLQIILVITWGCFGPVPRPITPQLNWGKLPRYDQWSSKLQN